MPEAREEFHATEKILHVDTQRLICQRAWASEQVIEHQNPVDELINLLGWKWRYFDLLPLSPVELKDFNARTLQARQKQDESNNWFFVEPWSLTKAASHDDYRYYHLDFYETVVGVLKDKEVVGTDAAFNCVNIAVKGVNQAGKDVLGLSHQHFLWNKDNPNMAQAIDLLDSSFRDLILVVSFEGNQRERIEALGEQLASRNIRFLGITRGIEKDSVGDLVVSDEDIVFQYGKRMSNHKEQLVLSWKEIDRIIQASDESPLIFSPAEISSFIKNH